jgi:hypothetical protein
LRINCFMTDWDVSVKTRMISRGYHSREIRKERLS